MSVRSRLGKIEKLFGGRIRHRVVVAWHGEAEGGCRPRVERARRRGMGIQVVRVGVAQTARTREEAEAIVRRHIEARGALVPIVVNSDLTGELLASSVPPLPEWCR